MTQLFDEVIGGSPPYKQSLDPIEVARLALDRLPKHGEIARVQAGRLVKQFDSFVSELAGFRERLDYVVDPESSFDPSNPDTVGRLVILALLAQDRVPLEEIRPTYGSGVYAIYYTGDHPAYREVTGTETPLYVGKADPDEPTAATPREQGKRLFSRLSDHRRVIKQVEKYSLDNDLPNPLLINDFECRRLICATNAQLVAERLLIDTFKPAWNSETNICYGMSMHGDNALTRRNSKSPWHVLHPGKASALLGVAKEGVTPESVMRDLARHFAEEIPRGELDEIIALMFDKFKQVAKTSAAISEAASKQEETPVSNEIAVQTHLNLVENDDDEET